MQWAIKLRALSIKTFKQLPTCARRRRISEVESSSRKVKNKNKTVTLSLNRQAAFTSPAVWTTGSVRRSGRRSSRRVWLHKSAQCPSAGTSLWPRSPWSPPPVGPHGPWTRTCKGWCGASFSCWPEPAVDSWDIGAIHWACFSDWTWLAAADNQTLRKKNITWYSLVVIHQSPRMNKLNDHCGWVKFVNSDFWILCNYFYYQVPITEPKCAKWPEWFNSSLLLTLGHGSITLQAIQITLSLSNRGNLALEAADGKSGRPVVQWGSVVFTDSPAELQATSHKRLG